MKKNVYKPAAIALMLSLSGLAVAAPAAAPAKPAAQSAQGVEQTKNETFGLWSVHCGRAQSGGAEQCVAGRQEANSEGQRVIAMTVSAQPGKSTASAALVLPFGVLVNKPVRLAVDGKSLMNASVRTCLPQGCVAPFELSASALDKLRAGSRLNVEMTSAAADEAKIDTIFVQLSGFGQALDRLKTVGGN